MTISIIGEFITIGQLLKKQSFTGTGGEVKHFLENNKVTINGKKPEGRNSKVRPGDVIWVNDQLFKIIAE